MTEYSYNGWSAGKGWSVANGKLEKLYVAGEEFAPGVRAGDVRVVLQYVAEQIHQRVEPIVKAGWHQADDWGYNYRPNVNNPRQLSCHASGTADDYNATRHPNGKRGTWTTAQKVEVREILAEVGNVVEWGEDFSGTVDGMHFEIAGTVAAVKAQADRIRRGTVGSTPAPSITNPSLSYGMVNNDSVRKVRKWFRTNFPLYARNLADTGNYLDDLVAVVKEFQKRASVIGPDANGKTIGPRTWAAMYRNGWK